MKKLIPVITLGLILNLSYAQQMDIAQLSKQFDKIISEQFKPNETGAAVLVARNGNVIYKKAFGNANMELSVPMQADNVFRIGSITKQFTAVAILQLIELGQLNLQDEITKFIPDYPTSGHKITIEHLLSHTSGIANTTDLTDQTGRMDMKPIEMIEHFKNQPMNFAPGTNWSYSNNGYFLLGYIIEKITGKTYAEYLEEAIFNKVGMSNSLYANDIKIIKNRASGYSQGRMGLENAQPLSMTVPYAAGSIQSTVEDLFKWHLALQSGKLIKKETLTKAQTKYILANGKETAYGFGWRLGNVYESPSIWHGGTISGFTTTEMYLPKEDVFVTIFSNCDAKSPAVLTSRLAALTAGKPYEYKEITIENSALQGYTGVFENPNGQQQIVSLSENQLYLQLNRSPKVKIHPYKKDMFFLDDPTVTLDFSRSKTGEVEYLTTKKLAGNEVWNKTNKSLPSETGTKVDEKILETYVGVYSITPEFSFTVTREQGRLFLQATGQEKIEMFADTETKFYLKVNDAQLEFAKDNTGKVTKVSLIQGGRKTDAKKVK